MTKAGKVFLIGAGPGDPELLTLRALRVIETADAVLHDALVSPEILAPVSPAALIEDVGKRCGTNRIQQREIHARMIELARSGLTVARLQGGDPLLFGRAGEEIAALECAGVDWEIIPGVTSASAAAAAAGIPLTDRRAAAQVILLTGHRSEGFVTEIPAPPAGGATIVVYMPSGPYEEIAVRFRVAGWCGETPCVLVSSATSPQQRILYATLGTLGKCERLPAPALLIVGEVAGLTRESEKGVAIVAQAS
jgi:uroporphyrin-III C-methyltransferase